MTQWTGAELDAVGAADELNIASLRADGTLRRPRTVWVVRHDDDLYVRSVNGPSAAWYRGAKTAHQGHITAGNVDKDVDFVEADQRLNDDLDAAYRAKYRHYAASIVDSITSPRARETTIKLVPR